MRPPRVCGRTLGRCLAQLAVAGVLASCSGAPATPRRASGLDAYCEAVVAGVGTVAVETDYIPRVVSCENGAASRQALEAQAVAARSYLYYRLDLIGEIGDGERDQVFTCDREPLAQHFAAAAATQGVVLQYRDTQVAAFYVAGALQTPPACVGGADDPTNTEQYVTLNQGRSGDAVVQSPLGFVNPANVANRGCMSQNGADCLSDRGMQHPDILRFYYGDDIELVRADGPCVTATGDPASGVAGSLDVPSRAGGCAAGGPGPSPWLALAAVAALAPARRRRANTSVAARSVALPRRAAASPRAACRRMTTDGRVSRRSRPAGRRS